MAGLPGDTPNMVTQPEPSGSTVPPEYAPSASYGQEPQPSPGQNVPNPVAASVSSVPPPQSNSGTGADLNNDDMAANYGHGRGATVPGVAGGGMPAADPSQLSPNDKHSHFLGTAAKAVWNSLDSKHQEVDPKDPSKTIMVQDKPGQFFRNLLGGIMIGAAAGYGSKEGGRAGVEAVQRQQGILQRQQEMKQQQQQQQIENQRNIKKDQREQDKDDQEKIRDNAQMSLWNIQKMGALQDIQGKGYKEHQELVDKAAPILQGYSAANLKPIPGMEHVSEQDHIAALKDPAKKLDFNVDWEPTGVESYVTKVNGEDVVNYQTVWAAYSKTDSVPINSAFLTRATNAGLADRDVLEKSLQTLPGGLKGLPYNDFVAWNTKIMSQEKSQDEVKSRQFQDKKNDAELLEVRDRDLAAKASARASGDEATLREMAITDTRLQKSAKDKMNANPDAWTLDPKKGGLTPQEKVAYQSLYEQQLKDVRAELADPVLRSELGSNDPAISSAAQKHAADLWLEEGEASSRLFPKTSSKNMSSYAGSAYGLVEGTPSAQAFDAVSSTQPDLNSARMALAKIPPSKLSQKNREKANRALAAHYGKAEEEKGAITNQTQQAAAENQGLSAPVPNVPYQPM